MPSPVPLIFLAFSLVWLQAFSQASAQMPSRGIYSDVTLPYLTLSFYLGLPPLFIEMSVCRLLYYGISILICPNMLCASNVSRLRLRAHSLKVEAAAWFDDGSRICDQCPGEDEHVQNEVHALLFYLPKPSSL